MRISSLCVSIVISFKFGTLKAIEARCFKGVSVKFQRGLKIVSWVIQRDFKGLSIKFQEILKRVSRKFQRCFMEKSMVFHGSSKVFFMTV